MEIVAGQRLDIHFGAGKEIADRNRLQAFSRRVRGCHDVHALAHERQPHLHEDLLGLAAIDGEPRRLGIGKAVTLCLHHIVPRRYVREHDLTDRVTYCFGDRDIAIGVGQRDVHHRDSNPLH